ASSSSLQARSSILRLNSPSGQWPLSLGILAPLTQSQGQASSTLFRPFDARLALLTPGCGFVQRFARRSPRGASRAGGESK
ncbi:MAG: hypothetical protein AB1649_27245, partial [Chloroflexota bacterium]